MNADYPRQTICAFTMVATGPPMKVFPSKGELRLFENDLFTSYVHSRSSEKIVTSAGAPGASVPLGIPNMRAGPVVKSCTKRFRGICRCSNERPSAVSRADDAEGAFFEFLHFFAAWMGRVIGGDGVDGAV